jgi:hypothetical protein
VVAVALSVRAPQSSAPARTAERPAASSPAGSGRLFLPRQNGLGYRVNLAHPHGPIVLVLLLAIPLALLIFDVVRAMRR